MVQETEYESSASLVDSIEAARGSEQATIDISEVFANRLAIRTLKYAEADQMLEKGDLRRAEAVQEQVQQPKTQIRVTKQEVSAERESAASRLRSMVGGAGKELAESVSTRVETAKEAQLVMPKLSLQDQLSDLEKIREGLDENVFDKEQISIIREEIGGMSQILAREDASTMGSEQRELVQARNQRVKEIKGRLNIK